MASHDQSPSEASDHICERLNSPSFETWSAGTTLPVVAVEALRTRPIEHALLGCAKIVAVMEGASIATTPAGSFTMGPGDVLALGADQPCTCTPVTPVRTWTLYLSEQLLREHARWSMPWPDACFPGSGHPSRWDGSAVVLHLGRDVLERMEPLHRRMSVISAAGHSPVAAAKAIVAYSAAVEMLVPALLARVPGSRTAGGTMDGLDGQAPVRGRLSTPGPRPEVARAAELLRSGLDRPWDTAGLAAEVNLSPAHLRRLFVQSFGVPPMRYLAEVRLTRFAHLVEETNLPIGIAARQVGWRDARIAAAWFRRRYRVSPSVLRRRYQPHAAAGPEGAGSA